MNKKIILFAIFLFCSLINDAQSVKPAWCGQSTSLSKEVLMKAQGYQKQGSQVKYLKVKIIIASQPGPGGDAVPPSRAQSDLDGMNSIYEKNNTGLQFVLCGPVNIVDDYDLYNLMNFNPAALNPYFELGYINIVYSGWLPNGLGGFGMGDVVYVSSYSGPNVLAHEIGHTLGLLHTHDAMLGAELVNGSNCAIAGDFICDTPADPNLSLPGMLDAGCNYIGTVTDTNGDLYTPIVNNVMCYSPCVNDTFTPGQAQLMNYVIDSVKTQLRYTTSPVMITPFSYRQCYHAAVVNLTATPSPGFFSGSFVSGDSIVVYPNAPGEYNVSYIPSVLPEDTALFIDQYLVIYDQYQNYQYGTLLTDDVWQGIRSGETGLLRQVDFLVHDSAANTFTLRVYAGQGINGALLYSDSMTLAPVADTSWITFSLPAGLAVEMDSLYTLELSAIDTFTMLKSPGYNWPYYDYVRGTGSISPASDMAFRTWVEAVPHCQEAIRYYEIYDPPDYPLINLATSYCESQQDTIVIIGSYDYSGNASMFIDGLQTNSFVPAASGAGLHLIHYVGITYGCSDTSFYTFNINPLPQLSITNLDDTLCTTDPSFILNANPPNGIFTVNGTQDSLVDPLALGAGTYQVTYSYTDPLDTISFVDQKCCNSYQYMVQFFPGTDSILWQSFKPAYDGRLDSLRIEYFSNNNWVTYEFSFYEGEGVNGNLLKRDTVTMDIYTTVANIFPGGYPFVYQDSVYSYALKRLADTITVNQPYIYYNSADEYLRGTSYISPMITNADMRFQEFITQINNCPNTLNESFIITVCAGVSELGSDNSNVSVSPNPFSESFEISAGDEINYVLSNCNGAEITTGRLHKGEKRIIDGSSLSAGIYWIAFTNGNDKFFRHVKLVKIR